VFADAYIPGNEKEMRRFYEKYLKRLKLKLGEDGTFRVVQKE